MKELLEKLAKGEATVEDVLKAIDDNQKDYVPRSRLNDKNDEIKEFQQQLKQRDEQLEDLGKKAKGNDELVKQIDELKGLNEQTAKDYQAKLDKQAFDFTLEKAITTAQAKNPKAVKALLNTEAIKLDGDKLLGLDEQLNALKESDGYLFAEGTPPGLKGRKPHVPDGNPTGYEGPNPWKKDSFNLTKQAQLLKEDPELAKQLQAQAKQ